MRELTIFACAWTDSEGKRQSGQVAAPSFEGAVGLLRSELGAREIGAVNQYGAKVLVEGS